MLNKLSFSASTSLLMRYKIQIQQSNYTKERGAAFEAHLHQNTTIF